jgi:phage-related protein
LFPDWETIFSTYPFNPMKSQKFEVKFLEEAVEFLDLLDEKVRDKIIYNITKAQFSTNKELFKKLNEEIWEFRTLYQSIAFRIFAFWDKSEKDRALVIITHGLIKKTEKTPKADLVKSQRLRKIYFENK